MTTKVQWKNNSDRATHIMKTLAHGYQGDAKTVITATLADLRHLAGCERVSFAECDREAHTMYLRETLGG